MRMTLPASIRPHAAAGWPRTVLAALGWSALYMLGVAYSDAFLVGVAKVTLFWPSAGVAFALVAVQGPRWALLIPLAVLLSHATLSTVPAAFIPFSMASNLLGALAGERIYRARGASRFESARGAAAFVTAGLAMAIIAAAIGTLGLLVSGMVPMEAAAAAYLKWAMGDLLGVLCIAPTLLVLAGARGADERDTPLPGTYARWPARTGWMALYALSYVFVYWTATRNSGYALGMVAFPLALLLWSAFRYPPAFTTVGTLLAIFTVTTLTGLGLGAFSAPRTLLDVVLLLGFLNLVAALPLLLMASIHDQRVQARRALRESGEAAERQQAELERLVAERTQQLDAANRQLEHASQTDALTGLRNRRYLTRQLPLDLAFYRREAGDPHGPPHALLFALVDIDHFKRINDTHGHRAGDDVLQQFAALLGTLVRGGDYAVRWGGEEFLLVLRPMRSEHVGIVGERICRAVAAHPFVLPDGARLPVTCSVGFAELDLSGGTPMPGWEPMVEVADAALYFAKHAGRQGWAALRPTPAASIESLARELGRGAQGVVEAGLATVASARLADAGVAA